MSVSVEWANPEKTVIYFRVTQPWTWEDYYNATDESWEMIGNVDHVVDFIVDFTNTKLVPSNAMSHLKRRATRLHPHKGMAVMVGVSSFMQVIINMMAHVFPIVKTTVRTAATTKDAYLIITQEKQKRTYMSS